MKHTTFLFCVGGWVTVLLTCFFVLVTLDPISWLVVYEQTQLVPGTTSYVQWKEPSISIYFQAYFFNLTNPQEFIAGGKPKVEQVGPYTYRERRVKNSITPNEGGKTFQYKQNISYFFDRDKSIGPETDVIVNVNLAYIQTAIQFGRLPEIIDRVVELLENYTGDHLITNRTVGELLWGYEDPFLHFLSRFFVPVPTTKIGLYLGKNGTDDGWVEIFRNNKDSARYGQICRYHGQTQLNVWTSDEANALRGSDGSLFHPYLKWCEQPYVFAADICRWIQLKPVAETEFAGVPTYLYLPFEDTFKSPLNTPKNRGFCLHWPDCLKDNILDMATCLPGAPIVMSLPHLMHADPEYQNAVEGLHPSDDLNTSFLIEPITGTVFSAQKKLQINAIVRQNAKFHELAHVHDVFLPIMFMNESFTIDPNTAASIRGPIYVTPKIVKVILSIALILSAVVVFVLVACRYWSWHPRLAPTALSTEAVAEATAAVQSEPAAVDDVPLLNDSDTHSDEAHS